MADTHRHITTSGSGSGSGRTITDNSSSNTSGRFGIGGVAIKISMPANTIRKLL